MSELARDASLDEIVFANRNKSYGAYALRKGYRAAVTKATIIGTSIFLVAMFTPKLLDRLSPKEQKEEVMIDVNLMDLPPPPIDENEPTILSFQLPATHPITAIYNDFPSNIINKIN